MLQELLQKVWEHGLSPEKRETLKKWGIAGAALGFAAVLAAKREQEIKAYERNQSRIRIRLIVLLQLVVLTVVVVISRWLGLTRTMWLTGSLVYFVLCLALAWYIWRVAVADTFNVGRKRFPHSPAWFWRCSWIITLLLNFSGLAWFLVRLDEFGWPVVLPFAGVSLLTGLIIWIISVNAIKVEYTPWFSWGVGATAAALLAGWCLGTYVSRAKRSPRPALQNERGRTQELQRRASWASLPGWTRVLDNRPMEIALLLSGGGYRAAVIHAGVLEALDQHCVPIGYLSTVSGGSIIGAHYALGIKPSRFKDRLIAAAPGLPDDLVDIGSTFRHLFSPTWSTADTYAKHFKNVFFGTTTLNDTGDNPRLLINVTDIEAKPDEAREILFKSANAQLNATSLAEAVAASGAFPGAFQAKALEWLPASGTGTVERRRFVDGGVVENLGLTGLDRYAKSSGREEFVPELVIISDASKRGDAKRISRKTGVATLMTRSLDIGYDFTIGLIDQTIGSKNFVLMRSSKQALQPLFEEATFTSQITGKQQAGKVVVAEVAGYDTLQELLPEEVEKAYWVGQTLGEHSWRTIDKLRAARAKDQGNTCPKAAEPAADRP
jgi:predicted acylesterase/phospholipase RssA